jgi:hypothetical protein
MADGGVAREGGCRCGQVRFRVSGAPLITMACHCTGCQRMTASAFSLSALHPSQAFEILAGKPVIGGLRGSNRHFFCPHCMSWLFTRFEGYDDLVNLRATMLDDAGDFAPFIVSYTSEKLPWASTPAVHSFEKFPPEERFPELMAEFATHSS